MICEFVDNNMPPKSSSRSSASANQSHGKSDDGSAKDRYSFRLPFTNTANFISLKLDHTNFLLWKDQFESVLISVDQFEYVDGTIEEPPRYTIVDDVQAQNPAWLYWRKVDRFVSSCLKATFTQSVSDDVLGLSTAHEIWNFLKTSFTTQFFAH